MRAVRSTASEHWENGKHYGLPFSAVGRTFLLLGSLCREEAGCPANFDGNKRIWLVM